jgi:tRNA A37 threonylcarbamoyladenosine biosynthesis protein TsaE
LELWFAARPDENTPYYWVKAGEDNGMSLVTHFDFYVYPKTMEVKFYDVVEDKVLTLAEWRKGIQ